MARLGAALLPPRKRASETAVARADYCGAGARPRRFGGAPGICRPAAVCLIDNRDAAYESAAWAIGEVIQRARRNGSASGHHNSAHCGVPAFISCAEGGAMPVQANARCRPAIPGLEWNDALSPSAWPARRRR